MPEINLPYFEDVEPGDEIGPLERVAGDDDVTAFCELWGKPTPNRFTDQAIAEKSRMIRLPVYMSETMAKLNSFTRDHIQKQGSKPTMEELAHELETGPLEIQKIIKMSRNPVSLSNPLGNDDESTFGDFMEEKNLDSPDDRISFEALKERLRTVLDTLSLREREVIKMRFGIDRDETYTLEELGKKFKVTRERIRQIEIRALKKLKHPIRSRSLEGFLDEH